MAVMIKLPPVTCLSPRGEICSGNDRSSPGGEFPRTGGKFAVKTALPWDTFPETAVATMVAPPAKMFSDAGRKVAAIAAVPRDTFPETDVVTVVVPPAKM